MSTRIQPWPVVRRGASAHPVVTLQYLLKARGIEVAADGAFGPATEQGVKAFQTQKHLTVDGIVGANTWSALVLQVKRGDQGDAVRGVQEEGAFRAGDPGHALKVDGDFGPKTEGFVKGFQQALELTPDGIVGPITWRALVSGMLAG